VCDEGHSGKSPDELRANTNGEKGERGHTTTGKIWFRLFPCTIPLVRVSMAQGYRRLKFFPPFPLIQPNRLGGKKKF
jgi:hypothetical protein